MEIARELGSVDLIFANSRVGTCHVVEKVVFVSADSGAPPLILCRKQLLCASSNMSGTSLHGDSCPPTFPELEEEHRSLWRQEWDRADIEIAGNRKASR